MEFRYSQMRGVPVALALGRRRQEESRTGGQTLWPRKLQASLGYMTVQCNKINKQKRERHWLLSAIEEHLHWRTSKKP